MPEVAEEKQGQQQPPPQAAPVSKGRLFEKVARAWIVLVAFCWAATVYHLPSRSWRLWEPPLATVGGVPVRPMLPIAAAFGGIVAYLLLRKFGGALPWRRAGQGTWARASAYAALAGLTFFGCTAFYLIPPHTSSWWGDLWKQEVFGKVLSLKPILFPSAGIFTTVLLAAYLLANREKWADFLIETEGELKKVSWPPRKEYLGSSVVVVIVVVVISVFLHFVDAGLSWLMRTIGIGF